MQQARPGAQPLQQFRVQLRDPAHRYTSLPNEWQVTRAAQHVLHAQAKDRLGMSADERSCFGRPSKHSVEHVPAWAGFDRVTPDG